MLDSLEKRLRKGLSKALPGKEAHRELAHRERIDFFEKYRIPDDARKSSVLILIYRTGETLRIPLIIRAKDGHVHSGQIALPGGRHESTDLDFAYTALRETEEEIGIPGNEILVLGKLSEIYIPPSNYIVHPYVGIHHGRPEFRNDPKEVDHIIEADLLDLLNERRISDTTIMLSSGRTVETPAFLYGSYTVWGATAMILNELRRVMEQSS